MRIIPALLTFAVAVTLAACGGGGDGNSSANGCTPTMLNPDACVPKLVLSLTNPAGAATAQVSPDAQGMLRAVVRDANGAAVPNAVVTFTSSDTTTVLVPAAGTVLTDSTGTAQAGLPAGTKAGAFTARVVVNTAGAAIGGTLNYAVSFPVITLSPMTILPPTLSAGGNASLSVTVLRGGAAYTAPLPVAFTSPCVTAGKATIGSPVTTQAGVAVASYSDKGCGVADVVTASVTVGEATVTRTGTINVLPSDAGSIAFVDAATTNIALKGTGGAGRQEDSTLRFRVYDKTGNPVSGVGVSFAFADVNPAVPAITVGGLTLNPSVATSDASGYVTTLVSAGTIPTSVRVVATLTGRTPLVTTLSNVLVVSTGVPDQKHFSLATSIGNCEGADIDQLCSAVTATLSDHFGNPVPDGTAVNFTANGGAITASCLTGAGIATPPGQTTNSKVGPGSGSCSVELRSANPRTATGRVTVLAYALGEENLFDANGNNVFDTGDTFEDKSAYIFRDDDENGAWTPGEPCIGPLPGTATGCTGGGDGQYNGVLRKPQVASSQTLYVTAQLVQIFSGSEATIIISPGALTCPAGGTADVNIVVKDRNGNIPAANSTIQYSTIFGGGEGVVTPPTAKVNNIVLAVGSPKPMILPTYQTTVACGGGGSGKFVVRVTSPSGVQSTASIRIN